MHAGRITCRALREAVLKQSEGVADDGTYKGTNAYIDYRQVRRKTWAMDKSNKQVMSLGCFNCVIVI